jgi:hypothetical protein
MALRPALGFIVRRVVAYGAGVLFLWHLGSLWAWWTLPIVGEVHFATRRYEDARPYLQPEDPSRRFARIRRGMNWDSHLDGWIALAVVGGLALGLPGIVAAPLVFEGLLTLHRLGQQATFWQPPPPVAGGGRRPWTPRPPRPGDGSFDRVPRRPRPPVDVDAVALDLPDEPNRTEVWHPRRLTRHGTRPSDRSTRSITTWRSPGPSPAPGA